MTGYLVARVMTLGEPVRTGERGSPWRYTLAADYTFASLHLVGVTYLDAGNPWVRIHDGVITIRTGYAWDGCSPKLKRPLFGLVHLGTPDGAWHLGKNPTYEASLVHDALCQWRHLIPISKDATVALFDEMLQRSGWRYRRLYVWAVRHFGPQDFKGNQSGPKGRRQA